MESQSSIPHGEPAGPSTQIAEQIQVDAPGHVVSPVHTIERFPVPIPVENPPERVKTSLTRKAFKQLCEQFGIPADDAVFPKATDTADNPPDGFLAVNKQMCLYGAIPPFNDALREVLMRLAISPFQLHPNGYAIVLGLCALFEREMNRLPTFNEIRYLCTFSRNKSHPSIILVRAARDRRLIIDLPDSVHGFLNQYFYVRRTEGYYAKWRVGELPALLKDTKHKPTYDRLNAVASEGRSIKFLLKDEVLHELGLLDSARHILPCDAPSVSGSLVNASDAPASKDTVVETSLVKCSNVSEDVGQSEIQLPIAEGNKSPQQAGGEPIETTEEPGIEATTEASKEGEEANDSERTLSEGHSKDDIYGGLSDLQVSKSGLFFGSDPINISRFTSSNIQTDSSALPPTPSNELVIVTQELVAATPPVALPQPESGL